MKEKPKVTVFYIATGKYIAMWDEFYSTFSKYFLRDCRCRIILFTDKPDKINAGEDVIKVKITAHPWPYITLLRFHIFMEHYDLWKNEDYVFFLNANFSFKKSIRRAILPYKEGLAAGYLLRGPVEKYPYERRPESTAYIPIGKGRRYYQGGFNGGKAHLFAEMCKTLIKNIDEDEKKGITAVWHDESHINKYLLTHAVKAIPPRYLCPEERYHWYRKPFVRAILRDKRKIGGHTFLRNGEEKA